MEVGHAAQNIALQAVSLGLGTVLVAAFHDENVTEVLGLPRGEQPLALIPIGKVP
jgi:nitroreductase